MRFTDNDEETGIKMVENEKNVDKLELKELLMMLRI